MSGQRELYGSEGRPWAVPGHEAAPAQGAMRNADLLRISSIFSAITMRFMGHLGLLNIYMV
jgi:hypothetical protein